MVIEVAAFQKHPDSALLCKFLVLQNGCRDVGECEDYVVEHCEDSVEDIDGDCDIEASISSIFLLWYAVLVTHCLFNRYTFLMGFITFMVSSIPLH